MLEQRPEPRLAPAQRRRPQVQHRLDRRGHRSSIASTDAAIRPSRPNRPVR
jgi:hypothetical protein